MSLIPRGSSFWDDWGLPEQWAASSGFFSPRVDVVDRDDHIEITAELPGVNKEDLHVTLENGVLTLEAEVNQEDKEEKKGKVIRQERRYGKYVRHFSLGEGINQEDINANFKDGVLKLTAPKVQEQAKLSRRIEIQS